MNSMKAKVLYQDRLFVDHSVGSQYVDVTAHANETGAFWAMLKRVHNGVYRWISKKHLHHQYVSESEGRHNIRELDTVNQKEVIVKKSIGKCLKYEEFVSCGNGKLNQMVKSYE